MQRHRVAHGELLACVRVLLRFCISRLFSVCLKNHIAHRCPHHYPHVLRSPTPLPETDDARQRHPGAFRLHSFPTNLVHDDGHEPDTTLLHDCRRSIDRKLHLSMPAVFRTFHHTPSPETFPFARAQPATCDISRPSMESGRHLPYLERPFSRIQNPRHLYP